MADLQNTTIYGYLHVYENTVLDEDVIAKGSLTSNKIILTQINDGVEGNYGDTSTPPIEVSSMGKINNLNADYLDNKHGSWYLDLSNATNYLSDSNLQNNSIDLTKLKNVDSKTLLGRALDGSGSVTELSKSDTKPILDLIGTNRGDQAVFSNIKIINYGETEETSGPLAIAPTDYDTLILTNPEALLSDKVNNKEILRFKMGQNVKFTPTEDPENGLLVQVGLNLDDGILKGSNNSDTTVGSYSPYSVQQSSLSFDISSTEPYILSRLNLNGALHASKIFVSDLININDSYVVDNNKFSEVLTTKKAEEQISEYFRFAFFNSSMYNAQGQNVGYNIVKSPIRFDDNSYTLSNILSAKKISDDFLQFKTDYIDNRLHNPVGTIDNLLELNTDTLEDNVLVFVRNEGLYRLSKFETNYLTANGKYVIAIPGYPNSKWIKVTDKINYHNVLGNLDGGSIQYNEFYHLNKNQYDELHNKYFDNQYIKSGLGMDFEDTDRDVIISLGIPDSISNRTSNILKETSHTHAIEAYDLDAVNPIVITDGVKILGNPGIIRILRATTESTGVVMLSSSYTGTSEFVAASEKTLSDGLTDLRIIKPETTVIGNIPAWADLTGSELSSGYNIANIYDDFVSANYVSLNNSIVRADVIKQYVDNIIDNHDILTYKGAIDCSTNPNYPAASTGESYIVSVTGKIGGANGLIIDAGDMLICNTDDTVSGDHATVGSNWNVIRSNEIGSVVNNTQSIADNFASFTDTSGLIIKDSGYNVNSFQAKNQILTNITSLSSSGIPIYNTIGNAWTIKSIATEAVGSTNGITIVNGSGINEGNIVIKHADTSTQASVTAVNETTWISALSIDDYGHITSVSTQAHPITTAKTVNFDAIGTTTTTTSGITVLDKLDIINDTLGHITSLSASSKYLPLASTSTTGLLSNTNWTTFNNKVSGEVTTVIGNIPVWGDIAGKTLNAGYKVEDTVLNETTINNSTLTTTNILNTYTQNRINYKGQKDYSTNPVYPSGVVGDMYIASVTGKVGGSTGKNMYIGDILICIIDDLSGGTAANWTIYRKDKTPIKKIIVPTEVASSISVADVIDGTSNYDVTIYRNGVYQLADDGANTYDYIINSSTGEITLHSNTIVGEKIVILINEYC